MHPNKSLFGLALFSYIAFSVFQLLYASKIFNSIDKIGVNGTKGHRCSYDGVLTYV